MRSHKCNQCSADHLEDLHEATERVEQLVEALAQALVVISNLTVSRGHESILLKKHPAPCSRLDFCVMKHAEKHYAQLLKVLSINEGS